MAIGMAAAAIGSAAISAYSASKNKPKNGGVNDPYQFFPQAEVAIKEKIFPAASDAFSNPYPSLPKKRALDPRDDPFASNALFELQQARDVESRHAIANPPPPPVDNTPVPSAIENLHSELTGRGSVDSDPNAFRGLPGGLGSPAYVQRLMQEYGLKRFYSLTDDQKMQVLTASQNGRLQPGGFVGFDPFSYEG